jgi:hypothetical protein
MRIIVNDRLTLVAYETLVKWYREFDTHRYTTTILQELGGLY